jgi:Uma2 family endonuclease
MAVEEIPETQIHRFTLDDYHAMAELGIGGSLGVELLDGLVVDKPVKSRKHENAIAWLSQRLTLAVDLVRFEVRTGAPLTLECSEPEPDVMVIHRGVPRPYHPATATLVVEVAVSSLPRDLNLKSRLYARAHVDEYWVVELDQPRVFVHTKPIAGLYTGSTEIGPSGVLRPRALQLPPLPVAELLAAANA